MEVHINLWGVLLSGVASMVIGFIYYANPVFGKEWRQAAKIDAKKFQLQMPKVMPLLFIAALVTAYILAYLIYIYHSFFQTSWVSSGLETALIVWFGISFTTVFIHSLLEQRPYKLIVISTGNRLLSILAIGIIIGLIHP